MIANPRPIHIAILDDDASIRAALVRLLQSEDMVAEAHHTADQLFEAIARQCPDGLLLDLQMPGMTGLDILKILRQRHIHIPTIIMTGHDQPGLHAACLGAGAIAYLLKPLGADQLIATIEGIARPAQSEARASGT